MDAIDQKLIKYLQEDCKVTTKALAIRLKLSNTAVYERVRKLERYGVIKKYVALIDGSKIDRSFLVFCQIKLLQHKHDYVVNFEKEIIKFNEVIECHNVSGEYYFEASTRIDISISSSINLSFKSL